MHLKIMSLITAMLIAAPLVAAAQTPDQATIQQLQQQIIMLQAQLAKLQGYQPGTAGNKPNNTPPLPVNLPPKPGLPPTVNNQSGDGDEGTTVTITLDRDLYLGVRNNADVSNLQEFLTDQGFYTSTISGNFFLLTQSAVKKFQQAHGLRPTGYVGPLTRGIANKILAGSEGNGGGSGGSGGINNAPQINGFPAVPANIQPGQAVSFSWHATDADNDQVIWSIDWGDGSGVASACALPPPIQSSSTTSGASSSEPASWTFVQSHAWANAGAYTVKAEVSDCKGATNAHIFVVSVGETSGNLPPIIYGITGPTWLRAGKTGTWTIKASDPENGAISYTVSWGDENIKMAPSVVPVSPGSVQQTATFTHAYAKAGTFKPTFIVYDNAGLSSHTSASVLVDFSSVPVRSLTLTAPNGGEVWEYGTVKQIRWAWNGQSPISEGSRVAPSVGVNVRSAPSASAPKVGIATESAVGTITGKPVSSDGYTWWPVEYDAGDKGWSVGVFRPLMDIFVFGYQAPCEEQCVAAPTFLYTVAKGMPDDGVYELTVPKNLEGIDLLEGKYMIRVQRSGTNIYDQSDAPFSIIPGTDSLLPDLTMTNIRVNPATPVAGQAALLTVAFANRGGSSATHVNFSTDLGYQAVSSAAPGNDCANGMTLAAGVGCSVMLNVTYSNPVPSNKVTASVDIDNTTKESDETNNTAILTFPILATSSQPKIQVLSPNGGEVWKAGETHQIQWVASDFPSGAYLWIYLQKGGYTYATIATLVPVSVGTYSWVIPVSYAAGNYTIYLATSVPKVGDESDAPFSIVTPPPQTSLSVSIDPHSPASGKVVAGSTNVEVARFKFTGGSGAATVKSIAFQGEGACPGKVTNLALYDGATQIGATQLYLDNSCATVFYDLNFVVSQDSSKAIALKLKVSPSANAGTFLFGLTMVKATGTDSAVDAVVGYTGGAPINGNMMTIIAAPSS